MSEFENIKIKEMSEDVAAKQAAESIDPKGRETIVPEEGDDDVEEEAFLARNHKRAWRSIIGLIGGVVLWISAFLFPESSTMEPLLYFSYALVVLTGCMLYLCISGRKEEPGVSMVGYVVNGAFLLFNLIAIVVYYIVA